MDRGLELKLEPGVLNVVTLKMTIHRHIGDSVHLETRVVRCHCYSLMGENELEIYRVEDGRLRTIMRVWGVVGFEEIEEE